MRINFISRELNPPSKFLRKFAYQFGNLRHSRAVVNDTNLPIIIDLVGDAQERLFEILRLNLVNRHNDADLGLIGQVIEGVFQASEINVGPIIALNITSID